MFWTSATRIADGAAVALVGGSATRQTEPVVTGTVTTVPRNETVTLAQSHQPQRLLTMSRCRTIDGPKSGGTERAGGGAADSGGGGGAESDDSAGTAAASRAAIRSIAGGSSVPVTGVPVTSVKSTEFDSELCVLRSYVQPIRK